MSDGHMLQISAERLAGLPDGTPLLYGLGGAKHRGCKQEGHAHGIRCYLLRLRVSDSVRVWLDLTDTVTAAVVAACIVRPHVERERAEADALSGYWSTSAPPQTGVVELAERMRPLTPEQTEALARLARAAMEAA